MKIKAFTFAELMISLVVIAVITAILYPTISDLTPNNNKQLFKSAYKTIEMTVSEIMNSSNPPAITTSATTCCTSFETYLNTVGGTHACSSGSYSPSLQTSNGMIWKFEIQNSKCRVWVDVNASNNKVAGTTMSSASSLVPTLTSSNTGVFYTGDQTTQDTFYVDIAKNGKITINDAVAMEHLLDTSN